MTKWSVSWKKPRWDWCTIDENVGEFLSDDEQVSENESITVDDESEFNDDQTLQVEENGDNIQKSNKFNSKQSNT